MSNSAVKYAKNTYKTDAEDFLFYIRCYTSLNNITDIDSKLTFNYPPKSGTYVDDSMLLSTSITPEEIQEINIKTCINIFMKLLQSQTHASQLSKYLANGYEYLQKIVNRNDLVLLSNYYHDLLKLAMYVDFNYEIEEVNMNSSKDFQAIISYMNAVEPCLCGSIVECCIAHAINAKYDWFEVYDYFKTLKAMNNGEYSMQNDEFKEILGSDLWSSVLYVVEYAIKDNFKMFKQCFKSNNDILLFKAFMHFVLKDKHRKPSVRSYSDMFPKLSEMKTMLENKFKNKGSTFDAYCAHLKSDLLSIIKGIYMENEEIIHNKSYNCADIEFITNNNDNTKALLSCTGESDFELPDHTIIDAKCYKIINDKVLRQFFYQTYIYSKLASDCEPKQIVVECMHNTIYIYRNVTTLGLMKQIEQSAALYI